METSEIVAAAWNDSQDSTPDTGGSDGTPEVAETTETATGTDTGTSAEAAGGESAPDEAARAAAAEAEFTREFGVSRLRADGKENRLPLSAVQRIAATREKKTIAALAKDLGIPEAEAKELTDLAKFQPRLKAGLEELQKPSSRYTELEEKDTHYSAIEKTINDNPEGYMRALAQMLPDKYGRFLSVFDQQSQQPHAQQPQSGAGMPQPNYQLPDGSMTYDLEGIKQYGEWVAAQAHAKAVADMDKRFKPIEEQREATARLESSKQRIAQMRAEMSQQPEFSANEEAIAKLAIDNKVSMKEAYYRFMADRHANSNKEWEAKFAAQRASILAELKSAPAGTSIPQDKVSGGGQQSEGRAKTTREIVAERVKASRK